MARPLEITIGGAGPYDPAIGAVSCLIPLFKGMDLVIEKRGTGLLKASEVTILSAGGFSQVSGPFAAGEVFFVTPTGVSFSVGSGGYSNGFNFPRVISALSGRLGWRQSTIDGAPVADASNSSSKSGRYFNDFHALNSLYIVKHIAEDPLATDAEINLYLDALQRSAILRALNAAIDEPEILELGLDFERETEINDRKIDNAGLFVGRKIQVSRLTDVAVQINTVSLYFDGDVTFPLYLFQEGKKAPIWTANVTAIKDEKTPVDLDGVILSFLSPGNLGGAYYLGYFQEDLGGVKAYDESRFWPKCSRNWDVKFFQAEKIAGETNFNRRILVGSPWSSGLNIQLSAFRDWTTAIVNKASNIDELIGLTMTGQIMELAIYNIRSNSGERVLKEQLQSLGLFQQLEGVAPGVPDAPKILGLRNRIDREIERVSDSFEDCERAVAYDTDDY